MKWDKKETARDIIALGSIPFYAIVVIRVFAGENLHPYYNLTYQFLIAAAVIFLLSLMIKSNNYASRGIALWVFTSLNYHDIYYTIFSGMLLLLMFGSLSYLKSKKNEILKGIVVGAFASALSYWAVNLIL